MAVSNDVLVSVIMPLFNAEKYVVEAINSVLSQTYKNLELIVVDDGSVDGSLKLVDDLAKGDARIRLFRNEKNIGVARTRNRAISEAKGEFIACLDNDDVALPERLEEQVRFLLEHSDHALVGSDIEIIDEFSQTFAERIYPHNYTEIRNIMLRVNPVANPASMFRKSIFEEVGGHYDESVCPVEDYELVLRIAGKHNIANIPRKLTRYRITVTQAKMIYLKKTIKMTLKIQRRYVALLGGDTLYNRLYRFCLSIFLLLPPPLVFWMFKRISFSTPKK